MYKKQFNSVNTIRLEDGATIPPDLLNADYQAVLEFLSNGGKVEDADPPITETQPIS